MVIDPVTTALIAGIAGSASKKFIDEAWDSGKGWLDEYFFKYQPEAQEKAKENALDFLVELGNRIQTLEEKSEEDSVITLQISSALSDPDFSKLLQNALISSARTSSKDKHQLMADVVSDRLIAKPESLKALVSSMIVDVIPHLSSKHLLLLGLITTVKWRIYPIKIPEIINADFWSNILIESVLPFLPEDNLDQMDIIHLQSVSCISRSVGSSNIKKHILPPKEFSIEWDPEVFLKETNVGAQLGQLWADGLKHVFLTSLGGLIGVYVHDRISGSKTDIKDAYETF